jgi:3-oxoacyl-[acyl-carrier-protein] synthase III
MDKKIYSVIVGTGCYIPEKIVRNEDFHNYVFYESSGKIMEKPVSEITQKFEEITGIKERRYVTDELLTSDISYLAAKDALDSSGIDMESLDYIICAHNFGDVKSDNHRSDFVPSIAARVKHKLGIDNPKTIAFDLPFGCPGWLQGMINADSFIKTGNAKRAMIIGGETLSRVSDPHDRDSMIYSDGAGATIIEGQDTCGEAGILSYSSRSDTKIHSQMLSMGKSSNPNYQGSELFLKMQGHKLYKYALQTVPELVKESIDKARLSIENISMVLLHQANEKMDIEILKRLYNLYGIKDIVTDFIKKVLPMSISWLGNSSVATLPTMLDLILKDKFTGYSFRKNEIAVFASVGAGMNINSMVYKFP